MSVIHTHNLVDRPKSYHHTITARIAPSILRLVHVVPWFCLDLYSVELPPSGIQTHNFVDTPKSYHHTV
jgi:hypothetical protein